MFRREELEARAKTEVILPTMEEISADEDGRFTLEALRALEQTVDDELELNKRDMMRKALKLAVGASALAVLAVIAAAGDPSKLPLLRALANGYIAAGALYMAPSFVVRKLIRDYQRALKKKIEEKRREEPDGPGPEAPPSQLADEGGPADAAPAASESARRAFPI